MLLVLALAVIPVALVASPMTQRAGPTEKIIFNVSESITAIRNSMGLALASPTCPVDSVAVAFAANTSGPSDVDFINANLYNDAYVTTQLLEVIFLDYGYGYTLVAPPVARGPPVAAPRANEYYLPMTPISPVTTEAVDHKDRVAILTAAQTLPNSFSGTANLSLPIAAPRAGPGYSIC